MAAAKPGVVLAEPLQIVCNDFPSHHAYTMSQKHPRLSSAVAIGQTLTDLNNFW